MFKVHGVAFYLNFMYSTTKQSFVIYIVLGDSVSEASKYTAKIIVEDLDTETSNKVVFYQKVISVEDQRSLDGPLPNTSHLVIPYEEMFRFFAISKNKFSLLYPEENGKWTVQVPVQIESITKDVLPTFR